MNTFLRTEVWHSGIHAVDDPSGKKQNRNVQAGSPHFFLIALSALYFLFGSFTFASDQLFDHRLDDLTGSEVERVFLSIASHRVVTSDFLQTKTITRLARSFESSGKMIFDSSQGIAWVILKPFPSTTLLTKTAMVQKSPTGEVRTMNGEGNETFQRFAATIQSIFLGQFSIIAKDYEIFYVPEGPNAWRIGLIPKDSSLKQIVKSFEIRGSDCIEFFKIIEGNEDHIQYSFSLISFPGELTPEERHVFD